MCAMAVLARWTTGECGFRCRTMGGSDAACRSMGDVVGDEDWVAEELGAEDLEAEDADLRLRTSAERRSADRVYLALASSVILGFRPQGSWIGSSSAGQEMTSMSSSGWVLMRAARSSRHHSQGL